MNQQNSTNPTALAFAFESHEFRVEIDADGTPWFNANDVCEVLELANPWKAVADHVDPDDLTKRSVIDALGRRQEANFLNESGLWSLIFGSTKPEAKRLKRWVTSEVLPAIRKTGRYGLPSVHGAPVKGLQPVGVVTFRQRGIVVVRAEDTDYVNLAALDDAVGFDVLATQIDQQSTSPADLFGPRVLDPANPHHRYLRLELVGLALARLCLDALALRAHGESTIAVLDVLLLHREWAKALDERQDARLVARRRRTAEVRFLLVLLRARNAAKTADEHHLLDQLLREEAAGLGHPLLEEPQRRLPL